MFSDKYNRNNAMEVLNGVNMKVILLFFVIFVPNIKANKNTLRIIGGRNASEGEFPYVLEIVFHYLNEEGRKWPICSSIVITSQYSLTAGHCIETMDYLLTENNGKLTIAHNSSRKSKYDSCSEILSTMQYPNYNDISNDIGMVRTQPIILTEYGKLSSLDYATLNGQTAVLVGYGWVSDLGYVKNEHLQVLDVIVKQCENEALYPNVCFAPSCSVTKLPHKAVCPGDSGGPCIHASGVIAITSQIDKRDCGEYSMELRPDRYDRGYNIGISTPISPFLDWIMHVMKTEAP